jgi:hypothetical protein
VLVARSSRRPQGSDGAGGGPGRQGLEQQAGQGPDVVSPQNVRPPRRRGPRGLAESAQHRAALGVEHNVSRLDGAVADSEIMQVSHSDGQGCAQAGDDLDGRERCGAQDRAAYPAQDQCIWRIGALDTHQLDDSGVGDGAQEGGLVAEASAFFGGPGSLANQIWFWPRHYIHDSGNYLHHP